MSVFPAARKNAWISCRWRFWNHPSAFLTRRTQALDIDALRVVADGVNALRSPKRGFLVITHYQRLLDYVVPDTVHVMAQGSIVRSGGKELALELEKSGYRDYVTEPTAA